jgi:membrane protein
MKERSARTPHRFRFHYVRTLWKLASETVGEWIADDSFTLAAALSFYTAISLAPLVTLSLVAASLFYSAQALRGEIVQQIGYLIGPAGAQVIQDILVHTRGEKSGVAGIVSLAMLLFGSSAIVLQLQQALNRVWNVAPRSGMPWTYTLKIRATSMAICTTGGLMLLALTLFRAGADAIDTLLPQFQTGIAWATLPLEVAATATVIALLFKFLPDAVILWRDAWVGAAVTTILFEIGRFALGIYLEQAAPGSAYGASGALVALLVWIYYSSLILLLGAEFSQVYACHCGTPIHPKVHAYCTEDDASVSPPSELHKTTGPKS